MLRILNAQNKLGATPVPPVDPIQVLVDEYKTYVTAAGGTIGVADSVIYNEYSDMITKGEIQTDGTNTKSVQNYGTWGMLLDVSDNVLTLYSLTKISGNYATFNYDSVSYPTALARYHTNYIDMAFGGVGGIYKGSLAFGLNGFYIEQVANISATATRQILGDSLAPAIFRIRINSSQFALYTLYANAEQNTGASGFYTGQATYKQILIRSAGNGYVEAYRNTVKIGETASVAYDKNIDVLSINGSTSSLVYNFTKLKFALT